MALCVLGAMAGVVGGGEEKLFGPLFASGDIGSRDSAALYWPYRPPIQSGAIILPFRIASVPATNTLGLHNVSSLSPPQLLLPRCPPLYPHGIWAVLEHHLSYTTSIGFSLHPLPPHNHQIPPFGPLGPPPWPFDPSTTAPAASLLLSFASFCPVVPLPRLRRQCVSKTPACLEDSLRNPLDRYKQQTTPLRRRWTSDPACARRGSLRTHWIPSAPSGSAGLPAIVFSLLLSPSRFRVSPPLAYNHIPSMASWSCLLY
ncbi:hypothetical protein C8R44DRAFT_874549 [Mycena epipterygia]|nr:hypothetical protein C8R44DRAFT_874549 [Mycena epipterygia]